MFKQARAKAGLCAPKENRGSPARLTLEEELRFIDQAYAQGGQVGLMMQVLLETGTRVSEFVALRVEDVSLAERAIIIEDGKGGKRREVPMRPELARLLALHIGRRRSGPLFVSRQKRADGRPPAFTRQRIGQIVRQIARDAGIGKRIYPHLLRHTMATRLLAIGMDITDVQEIPRARRHCDDTNLCRDQRRHAAAQVRPGYRGGRKGTGAANIGGPRGGCRRLRGRPADRTAAPLYMSRWCVICR